MKRIAVFISFLLVLVSFINAGPFGLEMGWTLEQITESGAVLTDITELKDGYSCTVDVTIPHPDLYGYIILVDKEFGLYQIYAVGFSEESNPNEKSLEELYHKLHFQLTENYGDPIADIKPSDYADFDYGNWSNELSEKPLIAMWAGSDDSGIDIITLTPEIIEQELGECVLVYMGLNATDIRARESRKGINAL